MPTRGLKFFTSPRQVAGGPQTENILKCQLKPLVSSDYTGITFSASQQARLNAVFPGGVCDWSKPGVGQQEASLAADLRGGPRRAAAAACTDRGSTGALS
jgi:hypothetical protein